VSASPDRGAATVVAAFDFDRTLSTRDNLLPFLSSVAGRGTMLRALVRLTPQLARARLDDTRRDRVKAALVRPLLGGRDAAWVADAGEQFAHVVVGEHLRGPVVARLRRHQAEGHRVVLVSASLEVYLAPVARLLGVDAALGTRLEVADGRLTGELAGANVRRAEKVRRLDAWLRDTLSEPAAHVVAYGDSSGDRELLARAQEAVRVGRRRLGDVRR
jgi:phosphatidylglycerophosphatase C